MVSLRTLFAKLSRQMPLRTVLVVPFVLQIVAAVGLTGYLSFRAGQQAVQEMANQLQREIGDRIEQQLNHYLMIPSTVNQLNASAVQLGLLDIEQPARLDRYLWEQMRQFDDLVFTAIASGTGNYAGIGRRSEGLALGIIDRRVDRMTRVWRVDAQGNRTTLWDAHFNFDPHVHAWYDRTIQRKQVLWSDIYVSDELNELLLPASQPLFNPEGRLIGVTTATLSPSSFSHYLKRLKIGKTGATFIMDRNGLLVASSTDEALTRRPNRGNEERILAIYSTDSLVRSSAQRLNQYHQDLTSVRRPAQYTMNISNEPHFLWVQPYQNGQGLDWLVVVVIPKGDFMEQIKTITYTTLLLCLGALGLAIALGIATSRWITRPLLQLSRASEAIAQGDWERPVTLERSDELGTLANAFNHMRSQVKHSHEQLADYNRDLERMVQERTEELQSSKEAAEVANRSKSEFLANMSHELRTPLNAILGFTQIMGNADNLTPQQQEHLGIINRSGEHLLTLINDVLDMSKIEAGRVSLSEAPFDLYDFLDTLTSMLELRAHSKGLSFQVDRAVGVPPFLQADANKLRQILINLLGNAIKFTDHGGVELRVYRGSDRPLNAHAPSTRFPLYFEIQDTGPGIAPQELPDLFNPFVQTEAGRRSNQGTGLGLAISHTFVALMGGELEVNSVLRQGSTFRFWVPVVSVDADQVADARPTRPVIGLAPGQPTYRILVVDDARDNRLLMTQLLRPAGFQVREALNGEQAIALWSVWQPHLIWMDIRMPGIDGYAATREIRQREQGMPLAEQPPCRIIALTASAFEEERVAVLSSGCDDFVRKPFRAQTIWDKLTEHLGVRYLYAEETPAIPTPPSPTITPLALQVMPPAWIAQLHDAAVSGDDALASQLVEQIPPEHNGLAIALTGLLQDFRLDIISDITEPATPSFER